jgi:hypothetical protein
MRFMSLLFLFSLYLFTAVHSMLLIDDFFLAMVHTIHELQDLISLGILYKHHCLDDNLVFGWLEPLYA